MSVLQIIGIILLPFVWALMASNNKAHRDETGVNAPTQNALRRIRRNARKNESTESLAYEKWVVRKQQLELPIQRASQPSNLQPSFLSEQSYSPRIRAPDHEPFGFEQLKSMASAHGLILRKQAGGLYYLLDENKTAIKNPYGGHNRIDTDFTHRDLEDFLLTC